MFSAVMSAALRMTGVVPDAPATIAPPATLNVQAPREGREG